MVDLYELKQLTAFADLGTLSHVAEEFHISTPSVTRSMQHLEQYFGVPLFTRGKNRITLNETGQLAVEYARKLLAEAEQAVEQVRASSLPYFTTDYGQRHHISYPDRVNSPLTDTAAQVTFYLAARKGLRLMPTPC